MSNSIKPKVVAVVGPTASGKTALSVEIAKSLCGEVVSADSMQIYKGMNIATAKPTADEMQNIPHHLIDFLSAESTFSVADYVNLAHQKIIEISNRCKLPIVAGGTGLYVDSLLSGISFCESENDISVRESLIERYESEGLESLLSELKSIDADSFERLSESNNPKRIIRAIEVYRTTGITMTEQNRRSRPQDKPYNHIKIALNFRDREKLYNRINLRVDKMLSLGLLKEAEVFYNSFASNTAVQAIGYKELKPYFDSTASLDECIESLKRATRRYAKRQLTWFKRDADTKWFYVDDYDTCDELFISVVAFLKAEGFDKI